MTRDPLISKAKEAANKAYAPYSNFRVGAALICADGTVYTGCNIENAAYSVTCCAERTALFKAVSEGKRQFTDIAVVGGKDGNYTDVCTPCGVCRQALSEFCGSSLNVHLCNGKDSVTYKLSELLPYSFILDK